MSSPCEKLLEQPRSGEHFVQLYESDERDSPATPATTFGTGSSAATVCCSLLAGASKAVLRVFAESRVADIPALLSSGQLVFLDAQLTMAKFMTAGQPDWEKFERVVCAAMREVKPIGHSSGLRAYGEMAGVLWKARQFAAAIRLEQLSNTLLEQSAFSLYCAYAIDVFGKEFDVANLEGVLRTHTHGAGATRRDAGGRAESFPG